MDLYMKSLTRALGACLLGTFSVLAACSNGGTATYPITVGGSINGLAMGTELQLQLDGTSGVTVAGNGPFSFPIAMPIGASYVVTVSGQPVGQSCEVWNGTGTVGASPVSSLFVTCTAMDRTVSGTVSGLLSGRSLVLGDNGSNSTTVSADGTFTFSTPVAGGTNYAVSVLTQPSGQSCSVTDGTGTMGSDDVSNVAVICSDGKYNVAVTVTGLAAGGLTLQNNGAGTLSISTNGTFNFNEPVASGTGYAVTVASEPLGQSCTVNNGTGTVQSSNVTNIGVVCVSNLYQVGGTLTGMLAGHSIVLQDNGGSSTVVSANGAFVFATPVASGSGYSVTILTQPVGQTCSVAMGSGPVAGANVSSVAVNCSDNTYDIQVSVSGLLRSGLSLQNNNADPLPIPTNNTYDFSVPVASGSAYSVTVLTQPAGETCAVSNGTGTVGGANVTGIDVLCTPNAYSIGGSVTGLLNGNSVVLQDNGGNSTTVSSNHAYTFSTDIASGSGYSVTVLTQPTGQNCSVSNGTNTVVSTNVTNVTVSCGDNEYNVQATVTGLLSGNSLVLLNNGGDALTVTANSVVPYDFSTPAAAGATYDVTVQSVTAGQTCSVANGSGTIAGSNVTATVSCGAADYSIGGSVTGLLSGRSIVLEDNNTNPTTVTSNTTFTFSTEIASGSGYAVTVSTLPVGQACSVTNGSSTVAAANVTNVVIDCTDNSYDIGGTVTGLTGSGLVLQDEGGDSLPLAPNGGPFTYTFATPIAAGSPYHVTVLDQPTGQYCTVSNATGTVAGSAVSNANVNCVNTYSVGGTLSGLTAGTLVLQDNGGSNLGLTVNGSFSFTTPVADGATYAVTVLTQPAGQDCTLTGGSGTVGAGNVTTVSVICAGAWTWMSGAILQGTAGTYGTLGTPSLANTPGARYASVTWTDSAGNLWLFGGAGYDSNGDNVYFDDLWEYTIAGGWAWIGGSATTNVAGVYGVQNMPASTNAPGSRSSAVSWTDSAGNLWLFGGYGYDVNGTLGNLNDLWEFSTAQGWIWVGGSSTEDAYGVYGTQNTASLNNIPGARNSAVSWSDSYGNFWLFGGNGEAQSGTGGSLNDLWMFNPIQGWTWVSGSTGLDQVGSYGVKNTPSVNNVPGARQFSSGWIDANNNLWVFGGQGYDSSGHLGYMNDLWEYNPSGKTWTWVSGSSTIAALAVYGSKGVPAAGNVPGARDNADAWIDSSGNLWLFGGFAYNSTGTQGSVDDLWKYSPTAGTWTWVAGSSTADVEGVYPSTKGKTAASNEPGARNSASAWTNHAGGFWVFGGQGFDSTGAGGLLNDLWEYVP